MSLLEDCPEVRSSGLIVEDLDRPRIHWPGEFPYYVRDKTQCQVVCPEWNRNYPITVAENVLIFADEVVYANPEKISALPAPPAADAPEAGPLPGPAAPPPPGHEAEQIVPPPPPPHPAQLDSMIERKRREA